MATMDYSIQSRVQELGDLELAVLVCLVAQQHCLFSTSLAAPRELGEELGLICRSVFGLEPALVECSADTTVEEFNESLLVESSRTETSTSLRPEFGDRPTIAVNFSSTRENPSARTDDYSTGLDERTIASVIIATGLDLAEEDVQVQALELIRTKRIFTRSAMHTAGHDFIVLAVMSKPVNRLSHHLNDLFCMSHFHEEHDGLPYLNAELSKSEMPFFPTAEIKELRGLAEETRHTPEIAAYLHNIVVFMRNSRYIQGGVTATATRQLRALAKALAPLHGLNYVPPSLIMLAVRKVYPHRLELTTPENEVSMQWGSELDTVRRLLAGFTIEDAIDDVLTTVETPL